MKTRGGESKRLHKIATSAKEYTLPEPKNTNLSRLARAQTKTKPTKLFHSYRARLEAMNTKM